MIAQPKSGPVLWRVGYHSDPLGFTPLELYEFSHRFDDAHHRFRTLYCAELAETCLREVLADFRPNLAAQQRHIQRYGPEAAEDFSSVPVTAEWRSQHVLVPVVLQLDGPVIDLTDVPTRQVIEERHLELLLEQHSSRGVALPARRETPWLSPTHRPTPSSTWLGNGGLCSSRPLQ